MTVNEFFHFLLPILGVGVLILLGVIAVQVIAILLRIKRMVERVETISDVTGWVGTIRKLMSTKKTNS